MDKNKLKILLVEDSIAFAKKLKINLENLGYAVIAIAKNSDEALKVFTNKNPDISILNIKMKKSCLDGIELAKAMNRIRKIPIIFLTSHDDDDTRKRAKTANPAQILLKSATIKQIDLSIEFAFHKFYDGQTNINNIHSLICPIKADSLFMFVKANQHYEKIEIDDIHYLQADGSSCYIYTHGRKYTVSNNLKNTLAQINSNDLIKVHRSFAINYKKIIAFDDITVFTECINQIKEIPVAKNYKKEIFPLLIKIKAG